MADSSHINFNPGLNFSGRSRKQHTHSSHGSQRMKHNMPGDTPPGMQQGGHTRAQEHEFSEPQRYVSGAFDTAGMVLNDGQRLASNANSFANNIGSTNMIYIVFAIIIVLLILLVFYIWNKKKSDDTKPKEYAGPPKRRIPKHGQYPPHMMQPGGGPSGMPHGVQQGMQSGMQAGPSGQGMQPGMQAGMQQERKENSSGNPSGNTMDNDQLLKFMKKKKMASESSEQMSGNGDDSEEESEQVQVNTRKTKNSKVQKNQRTQYVEQSSEAEPPMEQENYINNFDNDIDDEFMD